jgi:hypothetical protein
MKAKRGGGVILKWETYLEKEGVERRREVLACLEMPGYRWESWGCGW